MKCYPPEWVRLCFYSLLSSLKHAINKVLQMFRVDLGPRWLNDITNSVVPSIYSKHRGARKPQEGAAAFPRRLLTASGTNDQTSLSVT